MAWEPRAFVYHNFLSDAEVNHLVKIGSQRVRVGVERVGPAALSELYDILR